MSIFSVYSDFECFGLFEAADSVLACAAAVDDRCMYLSSVERVEWLVQHGNLIAEDLTLLLPEGMTL
jgi:hypothetical protein